MVSPFFQVSCNSPPEVKGKTTSAEGSYLPTAIKAVFGANYKPVISEKKEIYNKQKQPPFYNNLHNGNHDIYVRDVRDSNRENFKISEMGKNIVPPWDNPTVNIHIQ